MRTAGPSHGTGGRSGTYRSSTVTPSMSASILALSASAKPSAAARVPSRARDAVLPLSAFGRLSPAPIARFYERPRRDKGRG